MGRADEVGRAAGTSEQPTIRAAPRRLFVAKKRKRLSGEIRTCSTLVSLRFSRPLTQSSSSALPTKNAGFCKPIPEAVCAIVDVVRRERARRVVTADAAENAKKTTFPFSSSIYQYARLNVCDHMDEKYECSALTRCYNGLWKNHTRTLVSRFALEDETVETTRARAARPMTLDTPRSHRAHHGTRWDWDWDPTALR